MSRTSHRKMNRYLGVKKRLVCCSFAPKEIVSEKIGMNLYLGEASVPYLQGCDLMICGGK